MQSDTIVLDHCADAASSAEFLKSAEEQLKRLGVKATYIPRDAMNPNCGIRYNKPGQSGDISTVGQGDCMSYDAIASLEQLIESTYMQQRLNELHLRMSRLGWRVFIQDGLVHVEKAETGRNGVEFDLNYEGLYALEDDLRRSEMRHMILVFRAQRHLAGKDVEVGASIEDDGVCIEDVAMRKSVKLRYSDPQAPNKLDAFLQKLTKFLDTPHTSINPAVVI